MNYNIPLMSDNINRNDVDELNFYSKTLFQDLLTVLK